MIGNGCGTSIYPQFYNKIYRIFKMIPSTYTIIFVGTKGDKLLKAKLMIYLAHEEDNFVW